MKKVLLALVIAAMLCDRATAVDLYWDTNGATDGASGGTTASGAFTGAGLWNTDPTGGAGTFSTWNNAAGDTAHFSAGTNATGLSTITANATMGGLVIEEGRVVMNGTYTLGAGPITVNSGAILETNSSLRISTSAGSIYTLNNGTLRTTNGSPAGSFVDIDSDIVLNGGGTIDYTVANILNIIQTGTSITGTGPLTKNGVGVLAIASTAGTNTYTGGTIINDGELRMRTVANTLPTTTAMTVNSPGIFNLNGVGTTVGSLTGNGRVGLAGATLTVNGATSTTFSGVIEVTANAGAGGSGSAGGNLTKTGASTLTLTGANTYTGTTLINTALGALSIGDGGTSGSLVSSVNVNNLTATLIFNRSDASTYAGVVSGIGKVLKEGADVLTINTASEWTNTGSITVNGGSIQYNNSAFGVGTTTPVVINSAGTWDMNNINDTLGSFAGAGAVTQGSGNLTLGATSGSTIFSGVITGTGLLRKGADASVTQLSTQTLSGNNSLGAVRVNSGTLIFSGTNTSGATTVNAGTLSINGTNTIAGAATVVGGSLLANGIMDASGGTIVNGGLLGGTGNVTGGVIVNTGGRLGAGLNGGNSTTFTADSLTLETGSILRPTLGAVGSPLGSSDVVNVGNPGAFTLNGGQLEIATVNGVGTGTYRVLKYNGGYTGPLTNLATSTQAGFDSVTLIDNTGAEAIDVTIVVTDRNWVADGSGDWSMGSNWGTNPTQPNGPGAIANFVNTTPGNPAKTVTLDDDNKTVGVVNFTGTSNYTIAATGSDILILDTWGADAVVNVASGATHDITAPVQLNKASNVTVTGASDTFTVSGIVSGTGSIIKSGAGTLHLTGVGVNTYTGGNTVSAGTLLGDTDSIKGAIVDNAAVVFDQASDGTFASAISGTGSVTKNLGGVLTLSAASTFNGGFNLNAGTVAAGNNAALGATTTNVVTIADLTTLASDSATVRSLTYAYVVNGNFTLGTGVGTGAVTMGGTMDLGASQRTITVDNVTDTITAVISGGTGVGITKVGSGQLVLAASTNTYTGPTTVNAGTLAVDADGTIGDGTGVVNLAVAGVKLNVTANRTSVTGNPIANPINMTADASITTTSSAGTVNLNFTGNIVATAGTLTFSNDGANEATDLFEPRFTAGGISFGQPIVLATGLNGSLVRFSSFNTTGSTQTFSGEISGSGSFRRSASTGGTGGDTVFTAQNTFTGGVDLNDGFIGFGSDTIGGITSGPVGTGTITVNSPNNPGVFASGGTRTVANPIVMAAGGMQVKGSDPLDLTGTVSLGGVTAVVNRTVTVTNTASTTMSGGVSDGGAFAGSLTKAGSGSLILTGTNTYTGDTAVQDGSLSINNAYLADLSDVSLSTGATFNLGFLSTDVFSSDTIDSLFFNAVSQAAGTWGGIGAVALGANFESALITGTGWLNVTTFIAPVGVEGDYNDNGFVDAADYVLWRRHDGETYQLDNEVTTPPTSPGEVMTDDYDAWRERFGNPGSGVGTGGSLAESGAVPEPTTVGLLIIALAAMGAARRRR